MGRLRTVVSWLVKGALAALFWAVVLEILHLLEYYPDRRIAELILSGPAHLHAELARNVTVALLAAATLAGLHWSPNIWQLRKSPLAIELERNSVTEQYGIQTFPGITYIQINHQGVALDAKWGIDADRETAYVFP